MVLLQQALNKHTFLLHLLYDFSVPQMPLLGLCSATVA